MIRESDVRALGNIAHSAYVEFYKYFSHGEAMVLVREIVRADAKARAER